jgi:hypothetical protein
VREKKREFTEEEKKKIRTMQEQRYLRIHKEEFKPFWETMAGLNRSELDFMRGIKYGLILGIFGNLEVQYSFPLVEGMLLRRYDSLFFASIGIMAVSALVISITLLRFQKQRKEEERKLDVALEAIAREEYEIDAREVRLEAIEQGLIKGENETETKQNAEKPKT